MTRNTILVLAAVVAALALLVLVIEGSGQRDESRLLLADFASHANDIDELEIQAPDSDDITIRNDDGAWLVSTRIDYPADVGKLGRLVTDLSRARIVEVKTSDPENYARLAVDDPEKGGSGTKLTVSGEGFSYELIVGNSAQGSHRYVRPASDETSFLVDRELALPKSAEDWMQSEILDVDAKRVRKVTISHADGETVTLEKPSEDDADFTVLDVPEGRELTYASVGNGIAGALAKLRFEEVDKADDSDATTTTVFETWDGLVIELRIADDGDSSWLQFAVSGTDADGLGERLTGWRYRIADYKTNLLKRRLDDLLKPVS